MQSENKELDKERKELCKQRNDAILHLERMVADKKAMEKDLYQKFVRILNEKKRKIRELKKQSE